MSYYTGPIFEVTLPDYNFAIAAGGRYDEMIGKFCGQSVAACGFSIGFERIITIIKDRGLKNSNRSKKSIAVLVDKNLDSQRLAEVFEEASKLREAGNIVSVQPLNKNVKFQVEKLEKEGYDEIRKIY